MCIVAYTTIPAHFQICYLRVLSRRTVLTKWSTHKQLLPFRGRSRGLARNDRRPLLGDSCQWIALHHDSHPCLTDNPCRLTLDFRKEKLSARDVAVNHRFDTL